MAEFKNIVLSKEDLRNYPLTFQKIYYNITVCKNEEDKLLYYNNTQQGNVFGMPASTRCISKTIDKKLFNDDNR